MLAWGRSVAEIPGEKKAALVAEALNLLAVLAAPRIYARWRTQAPPAELHTALQARMEALASLCAEAWGSPVAELFRSAVPKVQTLVESLAGTPLGASWRPDGAPRSANVWMRWVSHHLQEDGTSSRGGQTAASEMYPARLHVDDVKTPRYPCLRVHGAPRRTRGGTGYTCVNFTPVAFARSKAFLMSSDTMRAMSQPSVRKTFAAPTFEASIRSPITDL